MLIAIPVVLEACMAAAPTGVAKNTPKKHTHQTTTSQPEARVWVIDRAALVLTAKA
jgi:hypothetical protein